MAFALNLSDQPLVPIPAEPATNDADAVDTDLAFDPSSGVWTLEARRIIEVRPNEWRSS